MEIIIPSNYTIYHNKDGRCRVYDKNTHKLISYPRLLVELATGIKVPEGYDVHHKDGDFQNNDLSNLEIIEHIQHEKLHNTNKYYDKEMICPNCGKTFTWTAIQQRTKNGNINRKNKRKPEQGPFCSKHCAGQYTYVPHTK